MLQTETGKRPGYHRTGPRWRPAVGGPVKIGQLSYTSTHLYIELHFGQQKIRATIDTGATRSFISPECAKKVEKFGVTSKTTVIVSMANGTECEATEERSILLQRGPKNYGLKFLVLPNATDSVVLGMDFLLLTQSALYCVDQRVRLRGKTYVTDEATCSMTRILDETEQKEKFLQQELKKFEDLGGTTHLGKHRITMSDDSFEKGF